MEKYIWKIINITFVSFLVLVFILSFVFASKTTFNNFIYLNEYVEGVIVFEEVFGAKSSDDTKYYEKNYGINVNNRLYKSTAVVSDMKIEVGDHVYCKVKALNLLKIINVNSSKLNNAYGLIDFISIVIMILTPIIIIKIIKNRLNEF